MPKPLSKKPAVKKEPPAQQLDQQPDEIPLHQVLLGQVEKKELHAVPISALIPYPTNPRKNDNAVPALAKSLKEYGYVKNSILVDERMELLAGHTTLKAMISLGWDKVPEVTQVSGLTESQKKGYRIADNKLGELAEWDPALLIAELDALKIEGFDIALTGFDDKEIVTFMADLQKGKEPMDAMDAEPQISRAEELRSIWGTETGQLWQCGEHRIICGDCTDPDVVSKVMGGNKAALFATDPPYGVAYTDETGTGSKFKKIANDENNGEKLQAFLESAFRSCLPHLNENAAWYLWHAQMTQGFFAAAAAAAAAGVIIHRQIIWVKPSLIMGHGDYHWKHELCFYGWVEGNRPPWYGDRKQTTVWEIGRENDHVHPTQKPIELFIRPLQFNTVTGDHALDPFIGSGSSLIACENTGRILHGIDIDPGYVAVCLQRYKDVTGNDPVLVTE